MNKKPLIILIGLLSIVAILISIFIYRNNLTYGQDVFQKGAMYGCMNNFNKKRDYKNSERKEICECLLTYLFDNYEREYLKNNLEEIIEKNETVIERCFPKTKKENNLNTLLEQNNQAEAISSIDTSKTYQKMSLVYNYKKNKKLIKEVYVNKKKDTFLNQYTFYSRKKIDSSKSKFYKLSIQGNKNDSILKGTISFFSPSDTIPENRLNSREVTFIYLQRDKDSLIIEEIITEKNRIHFDYKYFDNYSFVGFISDVRFFETKPPSDMLILDEVFFAIDSEVSTNNTFVESLK